MNSRLSADTAVSTLIDQMCAVISANCITDAPERIRVVELVSPLSNLLNTALSFQSAGFATPEPRPANVYFVRVGAPSAPSPLEQRDRACSAMFAHILELDRLTGTNTGGGAVLRHLAAKYAAEQSDDSDGIRNASVRCGMFLGQAREFSRVLKEAPELFLGCSADLLRSALSVASRLASICRGTAFPDWHEVERRSRGLEEKA